MRSRFRSSTLISLGHVIDRLDGDNVAIRLITHWYATMVTYPYCGRPDVSSGTYFDALLHTVQRCFKLWSGEALSRLVFGFPDHRSPELVSGTYALGERPSFGGHL